MPPLFKSTRQCVTVTLFWGLVALGLAVGLALVLTATGR